MTITDVTRNDEGEPIAVSWESDVPIATVVVKSGGPGGGQLENFEGAFQGRAEVGQGEPAMSGQSESSPCPFDQELLVKFEYNKDTGEFEPEEGGGSPPAGIAGFGVALALGVMAGAAVRRSRN